MQTVLDPKVLLRSNANATTLYSNNPFHALFALFLREVTQSGNPNTDALSNGYQIKLPFTTRTDPLPSFLPFLVMHAHFVRSFLPCLRW